MKFGNKYENFELESKTIKFGSKTKAIIGMTRPTPSDSRKEVTVNIIKNKKIDLPSNIFNIFNILESASIYFLSEFSFLIIVVKFLLELIEFNRLFFISLRLFLPCK